MNLQPLRVEVREAKNHGRRPRVHGNGFVQLDLTDRRRLHIWGDNRIPRQTIPSTIHDHTFSFRSKVYRGQLVHRSIGVYPDSSGGYEMYFAVTNQGEDTRLVKTTTRYNMLITEERLLREGDTYTFKAGKFHETIAPWLCVTVIDKDGPSLAQGGANPNVMVPFGLEPDNTFNRYQTSEDFLWQIINEALEPHAPTGERIILDADKCDHDHFQIEATTDRIEDVNPKAFYANIRLRCTDCETPFHFIGLPYGLSPNEPRIEVGGLELRAPIAAGRLPIETFGTASYEPAKGARR